MDFGLSKSLEIELTQISVDLCKLHLNHTNRKSEYRLRYIPQTGSLCLELLLARYVQSHEVLWEVMCRQRMSTLKFLRDWSKFEKHEKKDENKFSTNTTPEI